MISDFIFDRCGCGKPTLETYNEWCDYVREHVEGEADEKGFAYYIYKNVYDALTNEKDGSIYKNEKTGYLSRLRDAFICYLGWSQMETKVVGMILPWKEFERDFDFFEYTEK